MGQSMGKTRTSVTFHVNVYEEPDGSFWSEVKELPGCFASGFSREEVLEATYEAMQLWLPDGIVLGKPTWRSIDGDTSRSSGSDKGRKASARTPKRQKMLVCA
jgi:predicted RNase H-like HicB family nuclease